MFDEIKLFVWSLDFTLTERLFLAAITLICAGFLLYGLNGDSPICLENDELCYSHPAIIMVMNNSLNPEWFTNPASTLIYPLAAYYKILQILFGTRFIDPEHFNTMQMVFREMPTMVTYPRLTSALEVLLSLPILYVIGKRWVGRVAAMLGITFYALSPMVIYYGQILRPDMLASLFIIINLLLIDLLIENPSNRFLAAANGVVAGLAISTRFFCLALVPPILLVFGVAAVRNKSLKSVMIRSAMIFLGAWLITFLTTSPFVFIDFKQVVTDLQFEAKSDFQELTGLGPLGNLYWYLTYGVPYSMGEVLTGAALLGFIWMWIKPSFKTIIFQTLLIVFFVGTSLNPRHWERWVLPMLPVLVLLAGVAIVKLHLLLERTLSDGLLSNNNAKTISLIFSCCFFVCGLFYPFRHLLLEQSQKGALSARAAIFPYIQAHIPPKTKIALDMDWGYPDSDKWDIKEEIWRPDYVPPRDHNYYLPEDLAKDGYEYMLVQRWNRDYYRSEANAKAYPREHAFFKNLYEKVPMLIDTQTDHNPVILGEEVGFRVSPVELYDLRPLMKKNDKKGQSN